MPTAPDMTPAQQMHDLLSGIAPATRCIIDERQSLEKASTLLRQALLRALGLAASMLGAAVALGAWWLPLAPLPFLALNRLLAEIGLVRRAWRARRRTIASLARWPADAVADADRLAAAGADLPDLPGDGPAVLLVSGAADDDPAGDEITLLPAHQAAHARLGLSAYAESPEGQARLARLAADLRQRFGPPPFLFLRDGRGLVLIGQAPDSDGSRLLAIRQDTSANP